MSETPPGVSPYPRPGYGSGPTSARPPGVYFETIGEAWTLIKQDTGTWAGASLITFVVYYAFSTVITFLVNPMMGMPAPFSTTTPQQMPNLWMVASVGVLASLIPVGIMNSMIGGMMDMAVRKLQGQPVQIGDLFSKMKLFPTFLGANILTTLAIYVGFLLLIVPGIYVAGALALVTPIIARQELGVMESLKLSWNTLKPFAFPMFALVFVLGLIQVLGVILCLVGVIFTFPIYIIALAMHYTYFFPERQAGNNWSEAPSA